MRYQVLRTRLTPLAAILAILFVVGSARAGIDFLALDLPHNLQSSIQDRQKDIRQRIQHGMPSADKHVFYQDPSDLHISLVRFKDLSPQQVDKYKAAVAHVVHQSYHPIDLCSKVNGAKLHVMSNGWIVFRIKRSHTLTKLVDDVTKELHHRHLQFNPHTDFPDHAHISVAKVDPKKVSIGQLRSVLEGKVAAPNCHTFRVDTFRIKHAKEHHHYVTVATIHAHKKHL